MRNERFVVEQHRKIQLLSSRAVHFYLYNFPGAVFTATHKGSKSVLHTSLLDMAEQAPLCQHSATARGVLAEAQDLLRNAIEHGESPEQLIIWFSRLVQDVLHSPATKEITGGATLIITGAVGRRDALPYSPVRWLTVGEGHEDTKPLADLIASVGLFPDETGFGTKARSKDQWLATIPGCSSEEMAVFADAGTFFLDAVIEQEDHSPLLRDAINHRPPAAVRTESGLPDREVPVDVRSDLLYPVIAIARWAAVSAGSRELATSARIRAGIEAGKLSPQQGDYLKQAWDAGLKLQIRRWADGVHSRGATAESLPSIQRSIFGASTRMVSDVLHTLADSNNLPVQ